jgi:small subunit ribosomal protein S1
MSDPNTPESQSNTEANDSFGDLLAQYEQSHARRTEDGNRQLQGTVISVSGDSIFLDIGYKIEGVLPLAVFQGAGKKEPPAPGDKLAVTIKGRNPEGYYDLSYGKIQRPTDWAALEKAFTDKATILGTVIEVVKGGLSIDVGVRAFMPASRTGIRDAAEMGKLVGQDIRCRITKLDVTEEDVVVDSRVIAEEEARAAQERRLSEIKEGETVRGTIRSLTDYGAFVDLGGADALLHVGEIAWGRVSKPADVLAVGQEVEVRVLKVDPEKGRISVGMKQLQPHPWDSMAERYKVGERARGTVTRVLDFGAFVELEPGIEGLIHLSEMSWAKKARRPSDVVKSGDTVEAVVLAVSLGDRRLSLGLKQALGDPWREVPQRFAVGAIIEGPVTSVTKFGAFVQLTEGVEGMIHVSDISAEKRIDHPGDVFKVGQTVKAQVLEIDTERRRLKLGIKQMAPSGLDEYIAEHKQGDAVTGRIVELQGADARVELGQGVQAACRITAKVPAPEQTQSGEGKADLMSLSSMLKERWKTGKAESSANPQTVSVGQVRSFRIIKLDAAAKKIELEMSS